MKILGLSLGELATAAVLVDGEMIACVSEERFSRKKNDETYPLRAIEFCMAQAGIRSGEEFDKVVIASLRLDMWHILARYYSTFTISDYIKEMHEYWRPVLYEGKQIPWHKLYWDRLDLQQYPGNWSDIVSKADNDYYYGKETAELVNEFVRTMISEHIGVARGKINFLEHHTGHAAYAYYASPHRQGKTLVLTADAFGDNISATVGCADNGKIERLKAISHKDFLLARFYRYTTLILGMKPNEHEYKVMGLAPYAKPHTYEKAYQIYKNTMYVDGLDFRFHDRPTDSYFYFKERFEGLRFDGIAGGLQKYTEEILTQWVKNAVSHTGVREIVFSGGVSMNVKAMKDIANLPEVDSLFVPPSGGDESLAMGVCFHTCQADFGVTPKPLQNSYLGCDVELSAVKDVIQMAAQQSDAYRITDKTTAAQVAQLLAQDNVIGRCAGRMEFGARSLGNRSLLANPRSPHMVRTINEKIKNRDFWMPFAPVILAEKQRECIQNPKNLRAPYMTVAFDTTEDGWEKLQAAIHPADRSARAQLVDSTFNQELTNILTEFDKVTGTPALLNTSFNLHGEPIVNTPADAWRVFQLTDIDALIIGNSLIEKKRTGERHDACKS